MFLRFRSAAVLLTLVLRVSTAEAQTDVFPDLWVTDARVEGMAILGDTVFVAGRFRSVGPPTGQLAVLDKTTGEADISQPRFSALTSLSIQAIMLDGTGGYYVAGQFGFISGQPRRNLAHVLADGTLDPNFMADVTLGNGEGGGVRALALSGSVLYLGGEFDAVSGLPRRNLAAVDATTGIVLALNPAITRPNASATARVEALLVTEGVLYAAGAFTVVDDQPRMSAAAFDIDSGTLLGWNPQFAIGPPFTAPLLFDLVSGDGTVYVGGRFESVNGQPRNSLAEITLADPTTGSGGIPTSWNPTDPVGNFVRIGDFLWGEGSLGAFARVSRSTAVTQFFSVGLQNVQSLAYDPIGGPSGEGVLYVGGPRSNPEAGGGLYPVIVAVDPATGQRTGFEIPGATENNAIRALAVEPGPGGRLLAGGDFVTLDTRVEQRIGLAAFDLTTGLPTDFAADRTTVGANEDLALSPDGRFLYGYTNVVGGAILDLTEFDLATGATRQFIQSRPAPTPMSAEARTEALRSPPPRTAVNPRVENATSAILVTDDGAGGGRVCISLSGVVCFDRATTELLFSTPFSTVTAQGENNGDLLYLPPGGPIVGPGGAQGTLFLAGPIERSSTPDLRRPALAAIDYATGDVIASWEPGFDFAGAEGYSLALLDPDGPGGPAPASLYAGGDRSWTVQGQVRQGLAAFDPATAVLRPSWSAMTSGGPALAMAAHRAPGGTGVVYAGGSFAFTNGVRRACCVAAFDAVTGAYRDDWQPIGSVTFVLIASAQHEAVFMGGFGSALQGTGHSGLVAVSPASPTLPTAGEAGGPGAPVVRASVSLAGPNPFRSRTALAVSLPEAQAVRAELVDVLGRRVAVLHSGPLPAGTSRIDVDASGLPAGVYVARVVAGAFTEARTLTVVR